MLKNLTGTCNQLNKITKYTWKIYLTIDKSHIKVRIFMSSNIIIEKLQESCGAYSGNSCFYNY